MKFIDYAKIYLKSGDGGAGHISFRREKFVPKGGPDGGNGGNGGDVIFKTDSHLNTLLDFKYKRNYSAENGKPGSKKKMFGKNGKNLIIRVPVGTVIKDANTKEIIVDLNKPNQEFVVAKGGKGGKGNAEFATPTNQTPRYAQPGLPGVEVEIVLELKLIADVGLVGYPNVGKSTLISVISAAKPKIADYPFTTLIPNLGIVKIGELQNYTVADIPGLIEGASEGKGLGDKFLRHVERTKVLLFLIQSDSENPENDYNTLLNELVSYNPDMASKKKFICFSKADLLDAETKSELSELHFPNIESKPIFISSVTMENIEKIKYLLWDVVSKQ